VPVDGLRFPRNDYRAVAPIAHHAESQPPTTRATLSTRRPTGGSSGPPSLCASRANASPLARRRVVTSRASAVPADEVLRPLAAPGEIGEPTRGRKQGTKGVSEKESERVIWASSLAIACQDQAATPLPCLAGLAGQRGGSRSYPRSSLAGDVGVWKASQRRGGPCPSNEGKGVSQHILTENNRFGVAVRAPEHAHAHQRAASGQLQKIEFVPAPRPGWTEKRAHGSQHPRRICRRDPPRARQWGLARSHLSRQRRPLGPSGSQFSETLPPFIPLPPFLCPPPPGRRLGRGAKRSALVLVLRSRSRPRFRTRSHPTVTRRDRSSGFNRRPACPTPLSLSPSLSLAARRKRTGAGHSFRNALSRRYLSPPRAQPHFHFHPHFHSPSTRERGQSTYLDRK